MTAAEIAKAFNGQPTGGGFLIRCPCSDHGRRRGDLNPSVSISDGDRAGLIVNCHAGCDPTKILLELRRRGFRDARHGARRSQPLRMPVTPPRAETDLRALAIWRAAKSNCHGVINYLCRRGITIPPPLTLRQGEFSSGRRLPLATLVAAAQAPDGRIIAIQRTVLSWDGRKAPVPTPRRTFGRLYDSAVRLAPASETLGLAEGVETGLSAMQLTGLPVWASLGCRRLVTVWIPDTVRELHIFADDDGPGREASERAAERWALNGLRVKIRLPPAGANDWNDVLRGPVP